MFSLFDGDKDGYSSKEDFLKAANKLLSQDIEDNMQFVFDLYNFEESKQISRQDILTLLSHVPINQLLKKNKKRGKKEGSFTTQGGG